MLVRATELKVIDLAEFREQERIAGISDAFKEAAELALSDWDSSIIIGTIGDDIQVIFPEGLSRWELVGILTTAASKFFEVPVGAIGDAA